MSEQRWLVLVQGDPEVDPLAPAALDAAMALGAFAQPVDLLFRGSAVALLADTISANLEGRRLDKTVAGLSLYDVEPLYVCANAWQQLELPRQDLTIVPVDGPTQAAMIARATHVLSF